ncbi:MAG: hypothetical protein HY394_05855 [Candidatus Diapherotrites archaeon]|nr:hypothetical protein [Candidatus Diapherotrites archaeon]
MPVSQDLLFAQKYPFSSAAMRILKDSNVSLDETAENRPVIERAVFMIVSAWKDKQQPLEHVSSEEILEREIMAFPAAKIILGQMKNGQADKKFASWTAKNTFKNLQDEPDRGKASQELAGELGISASLSDSPDFFVSVALPDFLSIGFRDESLKLVNQKVSDGRVFFDENGFCHFLAEKVYWNVFESVSGQQPAVPNAFKRIASQVSSHLNSLRERDFELKLSGKIDPNLFPDCMASLYSDLLEGKNVPHMGRFFIAAFLSSIGMPEEDIVELYSKTPNFSRKMTAYQVKRIVGKQMSAPACKKVREYGFCPKGKDCNVSHPVSFYQRELKKDSGKKNAPPAPAGTDGTGNANGVEKAANDGTAATPLPKSTENSV